MLQVVGRADATIKIRGFKIGLPYVEGVLAALPGVLDECVLRRRNATRGM